MGYTVCSLPGALAYRAEIDGLRAIAVMAVIANHFHESLLPLGYLGVDVFFVISGFVIAGALAGRTKEPLGAFLAGFYARRAKRLLPALVLCVGVTALLISLFSPAPGDYLKTGIFALFGLSNLWLFHQSSDYFADSAALNPFTHTWSLGVEEQFYLAFPLVVWGGMRALGLRGVVWALAGLSAASALAWGWVAARDPVAAFYLPLFRFWEIGLGALLYLLGGEVRGWTARHAAGLKMAGLVALGALMAGLPVSREAALVAVVVLTAGLLVLTGRGAVPAPLLRSAPVVYLGRISYSLYLWHWPVMVLFAWTVGFSSATVGLALALALGLAHLSYAVVERPLRHAHWGRTRGRECLAGAGLAGVVAVVVVGLDKAPNEALYLGRPAALEAVGVGSLKSPYTAQSGTVWQGMPCLLTSNGEVGKIIAPEACAVGAPLEGANRRVLVIGNSFSAAFLQSFDGLGEEAPELAGVSFIVTSSWGASVAPGVPNDGMWSEANAYYWAEVVPDLVASLVQGDRVMIVSDLANMSPDPEDLANTAQAATLRSQTAAGLRGFAQDLGARGVGLSVLGPLPFARDAQCTPEQGQPQWFGPAGITCAFLSRTETRARMAPTAEMLGGLAAEGHLRVLDLFNNFCDTDLCDYVDSKGQLLYRDIYSHPSVEAARAVRPFLARHLLQP